MSLAFSQTTSPYKGIIQQVESMIYGMDGLGRISGNSVLLGQWTTRSNLALDKAFALIFQADGRWQFDDSNHTDYPTITTNLVANQRDYTFTSDENSNLILEIHKVYVASDDGKYDIVDPVNELEESTMYDGQNSTGTPLVYGKKGNGIFLDPIPSYSETNGLKIEITREGNYFTTADTTQAPGFAGIFHEYIPVRAAYDYALENNLANLPGLQVRVDEIEKKLVEFYSNQDQDERQVMTNKPILYI